MQTIVAGMMALTAMGASIISDVDPVTTVVRGSMAFVAGMILAGVWTMVVLPKDPTEDEADEEDEEVESEDSESEDEPEDVEEEQAA